MLLLVCILEQYAQLPATTQSNEHMYDLQEWKPQIIEYFENKF
jgi:hypothetical protein